MSPRHPPQSLVWVTVSDSGESFGYIGPPRCDRAQGIDAAGAHVRIWIVEQFQRSGHEQFLARAAAVLLARFACQRMQRPTADIGVLVLERGHQVANRRIVGESIQKARTEPSDHRVAVTETTADGRHSRRASQPEYVLGVLAAMGDRQLTYPSIEVIAGRERTHDGDRSQACLSAATNFHGSGAVGSNGGRVTASQSARLSTVVEIDADLAFAHELADLADAITMPRFRAHDLRVDTKPDRTVVTDADRSAHVPGRRSVRSRPAPIADYALLADIRIPVRGYRLVRTGPTLLTGG